MRAPGLLSPLSPAQLGYWGTELSADPGTEFKLYLSHFFLEWGVLELELRPYTLSHSTSPFCVRYSIVCDRILQTICPGWL
jgi:hypothetical protein